MVVTGTDVSLRGSIPIKVCATEAKALILQPKPCCGRKG